MPITTDKNGGGVKKEAPVMLKRILPGEDWASKNFEYLLRYQGEWIVYSPEHGLLAHHKDYHSVRQIAADKTNASDKVISMFVQPSWGIRYCLPVYFKTVTLHSWKPLYPVGISKDGQNFYHERMLIDSGADISVISKAFGTYIGLNLADNEKIFEAQDVGGGRLPYVERELLLKIDEWPTLKFPVAWVQDEAYPEMIIGREVVFDAFHIEFRQSEEDIRFSLPLPH